MHPCFLNRPSPSTFLRVFALKHDSRVFSTRYRVFVEPKQQEVIGYQIFPFASFSTLLKKLIFSKKRKVVSQRFDATTDVLFLSIWFRSAFSQSSIMLGWKQKKPLTDFSHQYKMFLKLQMSQLFFTDIINKFILKLVTTLIWKCLYCQLISWHGTTSSGQWLKLNWLEILLKKC